MTNENKKEEISYTEITNMVISEITLMELEYKDLQEKNKKLSEYLRVAHDRIDELLIENEEIKGIREDSYQSYMKSLLSDSRTSEISVAFMFVSWVVTFALILFCML